jgi:hypothetical protein
VKAPNLKRFSELSPAARASTVAVLGVSLGLVAAAQRDLHARVDSEIRGSKTLWRLVCLNALGAVSYLSWGRRPAG